MQFICKKMCKLSKIFILKTKRTFSRTKTPIKSNNNTSRFSQSKSNLFIINFIEKKNQIAN